MDFLLLIARRKWVMLSIVFFCCAAAVGISYILPQTFVAKTELLPPDRISSSSLLSKLNAGFALEMMKEIENPSVDLLQNILESHSLAERLARDSAIHRHFTSLGARGEALIEDVQKSLTVLPGFSEVTVDATVETGWAADAAEKEQARLLSAHVANLAIACMDSTLRSAIRSMAHATRLYADSDYALKRQELDSLDSRQEAFEQAHGVVELATQTKAVIARVAELKVERDRAEIRLRLLGLDLSDHADSIEAIKAELHEAERAAVAYETDEQTGPALDSLPEVSRYYAEIVRDRKELEPIVEFLRVEAEQQSIFETREKSMITVVDSAQPPETRSSPIRSQMGLLGLVAGLALSIMYLAIHALRLSWANEQQSRNGRPLSGEAESAMRIFARNKG
jgi:uncharacterized protein involved in exopolysaccharide biosynthesis